MPTVALKNVSKETWNAFKSDSARHGVTMGAFFEKLVKEHAHQDLEGRKAWDHILNRKPSLTAKEAEHLKKRMKEFRKGFEFRTWR